MKRWRLNQKTHIYHDRMYVVESCNLDDAEGLDDAEAPPEGADWTYCEHCLEQARYVKSTLKEEEEEEITEDDRIVY